MSVEARYGVHNKAEFVELHLCIVPSIAASWHVAFTIPL